MTGVTLVGVYKREYFHAKIRFNRMEALATYLDSNTEAANYIILFRM